MDGLAWERSPNGRYATEVFYLHGAQAQWVCTGDGTMILWCWDQGDEFTPGDTWPEGEDVCNCPACKSEAAPGCHPMAA